MCATLTSRSQHPPVVLLQEFEMLVESIIFYAEKEQLIVTTGGCTLHVLGKGEDGNWAQISKMRFATGSGEQAMQLQVGRTHGRGGRPGGGADYAAVGVA
eukprot:75023-Chlamydomonas_euryale.AAC.1